MESVELVFEVVEFLDRFGTGFVFEFGKLSEITIVDTSPDPVSLIFGPMGPEWGMKVKFLLSSPCPHPMSFIGSSGAIFRVHRNCGTQKDKEGFPIPRVRFTQAELGL